MKKIIVDSSKEDSDKIVYGKFAGAMKEIQILMQIERNIKLMYYNEYDLKHHLKKDK